MHPTPTAPLRLAFAAAFASFAPAAFAQHLLIVVDSASKPQIVRAAVTTEVRSDVEAADKDGALHIVDSTTFQLKAAPAFGPGFVDLSNFKAEILPVTAGTEGSGGSAVHGHGYVVADRKMTNCVIVVLAKSPTETEIKFMPIRDTAPQGVMDAGEKVEFDRQWVMTPQFDEQNGTAEVRFFSNGLEIPTSMMKPEELAAGREKTEAYMLRNTPDAQIGLVRGVKPIYPEELKAKNLEGSATLHCKVDRDGKVASVDVVSETAPGFGKAAADAVRQWTFSPAIKNHHYVETVVEFPVNFKAPQPQPSDGSGMFH